MDNESLRKKERQLQFNIPALQHAISSSCKSEEVTDLTKFAEGGFNRIFRATLSDGRKVLARLPYPSTEPRHYAVASEVATLEYLRLNGLPVPKVYTWSSTSKNEVGAEYIIQEMLPGTPLAHVWLSLNFQERYHVIEQIVRLEARLFQMDFPANGSLFFPEDLTELGRSRSIPVSNHDRNFCIGPIAHYSWWHGQRTQLEHDRGPFPSPQELFQAVGQRELQWTERYAKPRQHYEKLYREVHQFREMSPQPHVKTLETHLQITRCLANVPGNPLSRPVLRHPDLQFNNILLSEDLKVVGFLDWQHAAIVPLLLAAGIPRDLQNYGDPDSENMIAPQRDLPKDLDMLDPEAQTRTRLQHVKRLTHFLYAALTLESNDEHYNAIFNNAVILHQRVYKHAGSPWEGDTTTLQAELINLVKSWSQIVSAGLTTCAEAPVIHDENTIQSVMATHEEQQGMDTVMAQMRAVLDVDVHGWVPNEGYMEAMALKRDIKSKMMAETTGIDREIVETNFPSDDYDEDGLSEEGPNFGTSGSA